MIADSESAVRERLVLNHLTEGHAATDAEIARIRDELAALRCREQDLREEIEAYDTLIAAMPEPWNESKPPSPSAPSSTSPRRRRREGGHREPIEPSETEPGNG